MVKQLELMALREKRIGELLERVRQESIGFKKPPIIVIGGYALRAYVPFARYSRDCNFALPKGRDWVIDRIAEWLVELTTEARETYKTHGHLRLIQLIPAGKQTIKIVLDFLEGEIRGRAGERVLIDKIDRVIADVTDPRFLDSWRGTFITEEFTEKNQERCPKRTASSQKKDGSVPSRP